MTSTGKPVRKPSAHHATEIPMTAPNRSALLVVAALALGVATVASAAGQTVVSHAQTCRMTVPAGWKANRLVKSVVHSPDQSMSAVISTSPSGTDLAFAKKVMEQNYPPIHVLEDSPGRLVYEYQTPGGKLGLYAGVAGPHGDVCGSQITFPKGQEALARQIAASVGPVR
jgi:hypothetical protein